MRPLAYAWISMSIYKKEEQPLLAWSQTQSGMNEETKNFTEITRRILSNVKFQNPNIWLKKCCECERVIRVIP